MMKTLIIDNYDSFTYNLYQQVARLTGVPPRVVRNDSCSFGEIQSMNPDAVIISPGPGRPDRPADFGICAEVLKTGDSPLLGVCLGFQGIVTAAGGEITTAPEPMHGRVDTIHHNNSALFGSIPQNIQVVRYHSLCAKEPIPGDLQVTARSSDNLVMAVQHQTRPQWGVQFHPESICTQLGDQILSNFLKLAQENRGGIYSGWESVSISGVEKEVLSDPVAGPPFDIKVEQLEKWLEPEAVFRKIYSKHPAAFWLDGGAAAYNSRFSYMGAADGPHAHQLSYSVSTRTFDIQYSNGQKQRWKTDFFTGLSRLLEQYKVTSPKIPFGFCGGYVGTLGYELQRDCDGPSGLPCNCPTALLLFVDRLLVWDHQETSFFMVALNARGEEQNNCEWFKATKIKLNKVGSAKCDFQSNSPRAAINLSPDRTFDQYRQDIHRCLELIQQGESYEICLTNQIRGSVTANPADIYCNLRRRNPAPYGAYIRSDEHTILSSSPELFLKCNTDGQIISRPIKGTAPRHGDPQLDARLRRELQHSVKTRAENLMIVDLVRHDMGRICKIGSVHVPELMEVESYPTVHQLVSTVAGQLPDNQTVLAAIRALFPPGSMTGAPKYRSMQFISELEGRARGAYSGALGYIGINGASELSVVIRSAVMDGSKIAFGSGGAITALSDPEQEIQEWLVKTAGPLRALQGRGSDDHGQPTITGLPAQLQRELKVNIDGVAEKSNE